ncbi:hypothetical protein B0H63DRAFT_2793 [Podospora didyma]|uniref:RGS domain-containing protein n=1 Tax=Podospora didyma TaxID=330526 RepID=A0AAE0P3Y5_9PEZI|nr:hypothetical protein B0H63DRAFT_2793 [Podospora didyma]
MLLPRASANKPPAMGSEFGTTADMKPVARLDGVGIFWITFGAVWTAMLLCGMVFLHKKRHTMTSTGNPSARYASTPRLRGLTLTFAGLILLHLYWITVMIAYSVGPLAPEVAEFWIMGLWYPFGIALFQAGNSQFLHVAKAQSRFARPPSQMDSLYDEKRSSQKGRSTCVGRLWTSVRNMEYSQKMFTFITSGMVVQLLVVVVVYMISRKFHPTFGIPGTEVKGATPMEIAIQQGRGWEWIPSLIWQFVWSWIVAPIILWQSRGIRDTHGWQLQTMACCIAGLPAAPMWLIALYVPAMAPVNAYFVPPQWIALSITVIEIFTVFVPCWQVRNINQDPYKHYEDFKSREESLDSLANWQAKTKFASEAGKSTPISPTSTKVEGDNSWKKLPNLEANNDSLPDEALSSMAALEHVLDKNPEPLREFSARRDFSGENIAFLTAVADWKSSLPGAFVRDGPDVAQPQIDDNVLRQQFTKALRIYIDFISPRDAEFPINIAWHDLRKLEGVFERSARNMLGDTASESSGSTASTVTPFAEVDWSASRPTQESRAGSEMEIVTKVPAAVIAAHSTDTLILTSTGTTKKFDLFQGDIAQSFDSTVFDAAKDSIKYLVLTNTWPKYIRERRSSETNSTAGTNHTKGSYETSRSKRSIRRALAFLKPILP